MGLLSYLTSKRFTSQAVKYAPSAGLYGITGFTFLCYFTDWKLVLQHLPYYNTKFPPEKVEE